MTLVSISLKEYLEKKGDKNTKEIKINMQYSMSEPPKPAKKFEDIKLGNNFAMITLNLKLHNNFENGLQEIRKMTNVLKRSI